MDTNQQWNEAEAFYTKAKNVLEESNPTVESLTLAIWMADRAITSWDHLKDEHNAMHARHLVGRLVVRKNEIIAVNAMKSCAKKIKKALTDGGGRYNGMASEIEDVLRTMNVCVHALTNEDL